MDDVAAYARYSDDDQKATSIDDQLRNCATVAERAGLSINPRLIFSDSAITGQKHGLAKRTQYQRLIDAIEARECAVVIIDEISRLSRDVRESGRLMDYVDDIGLRFITNDGIDTARDGWRTIWLAKLMSARMEVESTGGRTKRGMLGQLERGYQIAQPPFGYRGHKERDARGKEVGTLWTVHEDEAQLIRSMYDWRYAGMSCAAIAARLQQAGVLPPGHTRCKAVAYWRGATVARMLSNTVYRGEFVWNGSTFVRARARRRRQAPEVQRFDRPQLRLVSDEVWNACNPSAQPGQEAPRRAPRGGGRHLFSGLVRCGDCGALLSVGGGPKSYSLSCPQCECAVRVGGQDSWIGYSSVSAGRMALEWVLDTLMTDGVVAELRKRLEQRLTQGPAQEERSLKERLRQLEVTQARLKVLALKPELGDLYADELSKTVFELRLVSTRLDRLRDSVRYITPQVLARQMEMDVPALIRRMLAGTIEVYKMRATLRRLLREFTLVGRPQRGLSVFRIAIEPGVSMSEFSDTPVIDPVPMVYIVEVSASAARPTRWSVAGRRM